MSSSLPGHQYHESGPTVPDQLDLGAPSVHFDDEEGYYYTIGGGSITAGSVTTLYPLISLLSPSFPLYRHHGCRVPWLDASQSVTLALTKPDRSPRPIRVPSKRQPAEHVLTRALLMTSSPPGPVRSKTLQAGSWELSPRAPMAPPAAETAKVGLAALDNRVYRGFYVDVWERETLDDRTNIAAYLANITRWNYGVTDPDFCCSDGKAPSYMLHTASQQGKPHDAPPGRTTEFAALARFNGTLNEWQV